MQIIEFDAAEIRRLKRALALLEADHQQHGKFSLHALRENAISDVQSEITILTARCRGSGIV